MSITQKCLNNICIYLIYFVTFFFSISSLSENFIADSYHISTTGFLSIGEAGWGVGLYALFYALFSLIIISLLYISYKRSVDFLQKQQFKSIFLGACMTLAITAVSSFVFPKFPVLVSGTMDNIGFLIFLIFVTYSMTRHQLFNIKVIAVELVTFALWIFTFIRIILAPTLREKLIESGLFVVVLVLGILLIQNVLQNVRQRKEVEELTSNLEKAYASLEQGKLAVEKLFTGRK